MSTLITGRTGGGVYSLEITSPFTLDADKPGAWVKAILTVADANGEILAKYEQRYFSILEASYIRRNILRWHKA